MPTDLDNWPLVDLKLQEQFEAGDVLAVWEAWQEARTRDRDIPGWVLEYLDNCAERLLKEPDKLPGREGNRIHIANSLGFTGSGPGPWKKRERHEKLLAARAEVYRRLDAKGDDGSFKGIGKLYIEVAEEFGISQTDLEKFIRELTPRQQ